MSLMLLLDSPQTREHAAKVVADGGIIAFRTDTFYGLGADPLNAKAIESIRKLKGRDEAKPILILVADETEIDRFVSNISPLFRAIAARHWPGPLTLIGHARSRLPEELTAGTRTIGVRLPDDQKVRALVRACGGAVTATSANASGHPPARTAKEVEDYFSGRVELIIDGGETTAKQASTVLDLSGTKPLLVREGAITLVELKQTVKDL